MKSGEHPSSPTHPLIWGGFWPQSPAPPSPPHLLQLDVMEKNAILGDISSSQAASSSASPPRAKARCFRSVRRGPSEAVCEITCLERKFLQLAAGSCPSLGWLQRSHPFRIYLFFLKKSSPMGLGRGRGWCRVPIGVRPFPLHPLRRRVPKSLSGAFPGSFPRWLCPAASRGSGAGAPRRPAGHARGSFSLGWAHQLPHLQLGFAFGDAAPAAPLAPAAPTWVSLPFSPPLFAFLFPFLAKYFLPAQGKSSGFRRRVS